MSIIDLLTRNCTQTAVYWGNPANDGYGGHTFDSPVEILCRWEEKTGTFMSNRGEQLYSKGEVYVLEDVEENGWLFLGTLADITGEDDTSKPKDIAEAYEIKRFDKTPALGSTTEFLRKAYL